MPQKLFNLTAWLLRSIFFCGSDMNDTRSRKMWKDTDFCTSCCRRKPMTVARLRMAWFHFSFPSPLLLPFSSFPFSINRRRVATATSVPFILLSFFPCITVIYALPRPTVSNLQLVVLLNAFPQPLMQTGRSSVWQTGQMLFFVA